MCDESKRPNVERILATIRPVILEAKSWKVGKETYIVLPIQVWGALEAAYEDVFGLVLPEENGRV